MPWLVPLPERGAILGSDIVEPVGEPHAASTFHVLWEDGRIAWNVLAKMAGDHACVKVVAAADADIDVNLDGFAAVEIGRRLRANVGSRQHHQQCGRAARRKSERHDHPPCAPLRTSLLGKARAVSRHSIAPRGPRKSPPPGVTIARTAAIAYDRKDIRGPAGREQLGASAA